MTRTAVKVTKKHIKRVDALLTLAADELIRRGAVHDASKFEPEELGPLQAIQDLTEAEGQAPFGSPEYERRKSMLGPMLVHHYANNSHHPEHYPNGVSGMCLFDIVEMFFDWKAASERGDESAMSLNVACAKYSVSRQLYDIFANTAESLGFKYTPRAPRLLSDGLFTETANYPDLTDIMLAEAVAVWYSANIAGSGVDALTVGLAAEAFNVSPRKVVDVLTENPQPLCKIIVDDKATVDWIFSRAGA